MFKKLFYMSSIPFILTVIVGVLCGALFLYSFNIIVNIDPMINVNIFGYSIFWTEDVMQGMAFMFIAIASYFFWLEYGLNQLYKKFNF